MKISVANFTLNNKKIKRSKKNNGQMVERCNHCGGAFKGSGEWEVCLMCGREKGHTCNNCLNAPIEILTHEKA